MKVGRIKAMELIFLKAVFKEKIWGGNKLKEEFNLATPSEKTGEAWLISAHPHGVSKVISPKEFEGMGLDELYKKHREIFGKNLEESFPLLVKILDASDNLSVQVHPDDEYAKIHQGKGERGKAECWYILSADEDAEIVYGHKAQTREEFENAIKTGSWNQLLRRVKVKKGDFFDVAYGTIHAIGKGIVILETQQSSDTTYRVYDYDRKDEQGKKRELHIQDSINVSKIPHTDPDLDIKESIFGKSKVVEYVKNNFFTVYKYKSVGSLRLNLEDIYYLMTVIDGCGQVKVGKKTYKLKKADSFIVPQDIRDIEFKGDLEIIASKPSR